MLTIFRRIQELYEEGRMAALATVVETSGSTPRKPGAKMIVFPDGSIEGTIGGGAVEKRIIEDAIKILYNGERRLIHIDLSDNKSDNSVGAACGGELRIYIEPVGVMTRLIIFGAGHVGQTLSRMARELNLQVIVYDDREEYARQDRFPSDVKVFCSPFDQSMELLQPSSLDYLVIMTCNHVSDELLAQLALITEARYIGMIGSGQKCKRVKENLAEKGISPDRIDFLHAPIGIPIGGHTPAEIAVSVLAEIVQVSNNDSISPG